MQSLAALREDVESALGPRFAAQIGFRERPAPGFSPTGVAELDAVTGGLPRGSIVDLYGPASSGRTTLLVAMLAAATARGETCALVDSGDTLDPVSADAAGVDLARLLWVRCGGRPDHALKAAEMLVEGGGFGLVALDFGDLPAQVARRIPLASWYRFRRAVENTPASIVVVEREPTAKSCASLMLEMERQGAEWPGAPGCSRLLSGVRLRAARRKPAGSEKASFEARAIG
jgi:recombination protein RecA